MRREVDMRCVKTSMIIPTVLCCAMAVEGETAFCCNITPFCDPSAPGRSLQCKWLRGLFYIVLFCVNGKKEKGKKMKKWAQRNVSIQLKDQEVAEEQQCEHLQ